MSPILRRTLLAVCVILIVYSVRRPALDAQNPPCVSPPVLGHSYAWQQNATIYVSVNSNDFSPQEYECLRTAFLNWNSSAQDNTSNVFFVVDRTPNRLVTYDASGHSTSVDSNVYQVDRGSFANFPIAVAVTGGSTYGGDYRLDAFTVINPQVHNCQALINDMAHEIGHTFGLDECTNCRFAHSAVMEGVACAQYNTATPPECILPAYDDTSTGLPGPTTCENAVVANEGLFPPPPPPGPVCECDVCSGETGGSGGTCSPILLNLGTEGYYQLTGARDGVAFDLDGDGVIRGRVGWPEKGSQLAFLARDNNHNGVIENGTELFGNHTILASGQPAANGFLALAEFDETQHGGNADGWIDTTDSVWSELRLWIDADHNGVSSPTEILRLEDAGISAISLNAAPEMRRDRYGNLFRFRGIYVLRGLPRKGFDVYFVTAPR